MSAGKLSASYADRAGRRHGKPSDLPALKTLRSDSHIKTEVANDDGKTRSEADWDRIFKMFVAHGYRGYMGLEYEAEADAAAKVPAELRRLAGMSRKYSA